MKFETFSSLLTTDDERFVTPFLTKQGSLCFIASQHEDIDSARSEFTAFEGMTGLRSIAPTMHPEQLGEWVEAMVNFCLAKANEPIVELEYPPT